MSESNIPPLRGWAPVFVRDYRHCAPMGLGVKRWCGRNRRAIQQVRSAQNIPPRRGWAPAIVRDYRHCVPMGLDVERTQP